MRPPNATDPMINTLSGRFLILTVIFVMVAEILIFLPSIARFREEYMLARLERAQIASLNLLAAGEMIEADVEEELLSNAGVLNVVLRRDVARELVLSGPLPFPVGKTVDLRDDRALILIRDAISRIVNPEPEVIRVLGQPVMGGGIQIEFALDSRPLRKALLEYGRNIFWLSLMISAITAVLLFMAVRRLLVMPIRKLVEQMDRFAEAPEDARRIVRPASSVVELRAAEEALSAMQTQLSNSLKQKERLAQLGGAVAKISHDLRNILTTATLLGDRLESVDDPTVKRVGPKIVNSISRAVSLCEGTLAFGKAEESPPALTRFDLSVLAKDIAESEQLAVAPEVVEIIADVPADLTVRADPDQLHRVLGNLVRNARQVIEATGKPGTVTLMAREEAKAWWIEVVDTGPGLPPKAQEFLFKPFQGTARKGGTGLGLAIAAELIKGHGGSLKLKQTGPEGTTFCICLPRDGILERV